MFHISIIESIHPKAIENIANNPEFSHEVIENIDEEYLSKKLQNTDAIAIRTSNLSARILENCNKLKIVSRHGVGYDNVDLGTLNKKIFHICY